MMMTSEGKHLQGAMNFLFDQTKKNHPKQKSDFGQDRTGYLECVRLM